MQLAGCALLALAWSEGNQTVQAFPERTDAGIAAEIKAAERLASVQAARGLSSVQVIVSRNDTLDSIFRRLQLSLHDLAAIRALPSLTPHFDRLYPGELLKLTYKGDVFIGLERRVSPSSTLSVIRQPEGFASKLIEVPLETRKHIVHGVIDSSLFQAVDAAGLNDGIAVALADIFAWDIDFAQDIQVGDEFDVTYETIMQDGKYLRDGNVLAARFVNQGRTYEAVRYVSPDGTVGYYTPEGRSLRRAFIRAPVDFTRVSSGFNASRFHPILNRIRAHKGVDYAAPIGTPVHAAGDGRVSFVGMRGGYGNVIELDHSRGISTVYGHLSRFARGLRRGQLVKQSQVIGAVGMTGLATGPHLHYEYRINGVHRNPQTVPLPSAEPVPAQWQADFQKQSAPLLKTLAQPPHPAFAAR